MKFLIYGHQGWIGNQVINILKEIKGVKSILQSGLGQEPQIQ